MKENEITEIERRLLSHCVHPTSELGGVVADGLALLKSLREANQARAIDRPFKVIIEHSNTKRTIEGAFNICGDPKVLRSIAAQLLEQTDEHGAGYGWRRIRPYAEQQASVSNEPPVSWDEARRGER